MVDVIFRSAQGPPSNLIRNLVPHIITVAESFNENILIFIWSLHPLKSTMAVDKGDRKRKLFMPTDDEAPALKKCFSNLTNLNAGRNNTNTDAKSGSQSESSQSGEICVAQVHHGKGSSEDVWVNMMRNIKRTLEHDFKAVTKRLQLPTTPPCLYDGSLKQCLQLHSNKSKALFASDQNQYLAKIIAEDRSFQFIQFVRNNMCGRQEFPGIDVIRNILELMLVRFDTALIRLN